MPNPQTASVTDAFERALGAIRARVSASAGASNIPLQRFAVAYSGGLDSAALLHLAHAYANEHGITLFAFHIHHGLSPNADTWLLHCENECARLGIHFDARRVALADREREGIEQAARTSRYAALGELCRAHEIPLLLTAHHQDDQAETVLLQLLRGAGVAGLSGMDLLCTAPGLLGDEHLMIGRPLLELSRAGLEEFVAQRAIAYVVDESNADLRYARNALRHEVMPSLGKYFPGFQQRLARAAQHAQSAQRMLNELAAHDLADCTCAEAECIDIARLRQLSSDRIDNVLRRWFALNNVRMPSTAWLSEMRMQLLGAREDAQVLVTHADCEIRRHRGKIYLIPRMQNVDGLWDPAIFRWNGEAEILFPEYGGGLQFDVTGAGIDANWLRGQVLHLRWRSGGEKLKAAADRPTKSLKHHFQALDVPPWERSRLPVVTTESDALLFAAGIGINWRNIPIVPEAGVTLRWERKLP